jgi:hypothetical protein
LLLRRLHVDELHKILAQALTLAVLLFLSFVHNLRHLRDSFFNGGVNLHGDRFVHLIESLHVARMHVVHKCPKLLEFKIYGIHLA